VTRPAAVIGSELDSAEGFILLRAVFLDALVVRVIAHFLTALFHEAAARGRNGVW